MAASLHLAAHPARKRNTGETPPLTLTATPILQLSHKPLAGALRKQGAKLNPSGDVGIHSILVGDFRWCLPRWGGTFGTNPPVGRLTCKHWRSLSCPV